MMPIEDADYFVRLVPFPNRGADALVVSNGDGTYSVYLDARLDRDHQIDGYSHELDHMIRDDLHRNDASIEEIENAGP